MKILYLVNSDSVAMGFLKKEVVKAKGFDCKNREKSYSWTTTNVLLKEKFYGKTYHATDGTYGLASIK